MMDKMIPKFLRSDLDTRPGGYNPVEHPLMDATGPVQYVPQRREVIPAPQAQRRRLSEAAAQAAEQWENLEAENHTLRVGLETERAKNSVLEQSNLILHEEFEKLKTEHDYHQRRCIRLLTYIEQMGSLALSAAKDIEPEIIRHAVEAATQPKPELIQNETPIATEDRKVPLFSTETNPPRPEGEQTPLQDRSVQSNG